MPSPIEQQDANVLDVPRPAVAVTAIAFIPNINITSMSVDVSVPRAVQSGFVAVGAGSWLRTFDVRTGTLISAVHCLPTAAIHTIAPSEFDDSSVLVSGQRSACVICISRDSGVIDTKHANHVTLESMRDLVWDSRFVDKTHAVFAMAMGIVQLWQVLPSAAESNNNMNAANVKFVPRLLAQTVCAARRICYSMSFHPTLSMNSVWLVSGTVFGKLLVWKADLKVPDAKTNDTTISSNDDVSETVSDVSQKLEGHKGAVFRVRWSPDGRQLCSVSDDRTVRLWEVSDAAPTDAPPTTSTTTTDLITSAAPEHQQSAAPSWVVLPNGTRQVATFVCLWSTFGHRSRVWDCAFWGSSIGAQMGPLEGIGAGVGGVVTVGEDCTARVWDAKGGLISTIESAHEGMNCWQCAVDPIAGTVLVTGGADCCAKLWDMSLVAGALESVATYVAPNNDVPSNVEPSNAVPGNAVPSIVVPTNAGTANTVDIAIDGKNAKVTADAHGDVNMVSASSVVVESSDVNNVVRMDDDMDSLCTGKRGRNGKPCVPATAAVGSDKELKESDVKTGVHEKKKNKNKKNNNNPEKKQKQKQKKKGGKASQQEILEEPGLEVRFPITQDIASNGVPTTCNIHALAMANDGDYVFAATRSDGQMPKFWRMSLNDNNINNNSQSASLSSVSGGGAATVADNHQTSNIPPPSPFKFLYMPPVPCSGTTAGPLAAKVADAQRVCVLEVSPCGSWLAAGLKSGVVMLIPTSPTSLSCSPSSNYAQHFNAHRSRVSVLAFVEAPSQHYSSGKDTNEEDIWVVTGFGDGLLTLCVANNNKNGSDPVIVHEFKLKQGSVPLCVCLFLKRFLLVGDLRGNIHIFDLEHPATTTRPTASDSLSQICTSESAEVQPNLSSNSDALATKTVASSAITVLNRVHGTCKVSVLTVSSCGTMVYSAGHNGTVAELRLCDDGKSLRCTREHRASPITSITHLTLTTECSSNRNGSLGNDSLVVHGFHGDHFYIADISSRPYSILRATNGGWRRPCVSWVGKSQVAVMYVPSGNRYVGGRVRLMQHAPNQRTAFGYGLPDAGNVLGRAVLPEFAKRTLGWSVHGRAAWSVAWASNASGGENSSEDIFSKLFVSGAEDLRVKLCSVRDSDLQVVSSLSNFGFPLRCLALRRIQRRMEEEKEETDAQAEYRLVIGGGREVVQCWRTLLSSSPSSTSSSEIAVPESSFELLCEIKGAPDNENQRMLAVSFLDDNFFVMSNSRGQAFVYESKRDGPSGLVTSACETGTAESHMDVTSGYSLNVVVELPRALDARGPMLSLDSCVLSIGESQVTVVCGGRTDGSVQVWAKHDSKQWADVKDLGVSYDGHTMGTNCVSISACGPAGDHVCIASGGDDQAVAVSVVRVSDAGAGGVVLEVLKALRVVNADASAVRGVFTNGSTVYSVGINQHLRTWDVTAVVSEGVKQEMDVNVNVEEVFVDRLSGVTGGGCVVSLKRDVVVDVSDVNDMAVSAAGALVVGAGIEFVPTTALIE